MTYKILIVDDEIANLRLMERLFRRSYQVLTALSAKEGLELLKQHDIALIISDQRMPGMTGIEFLKHASEMRQHTVRIILTGYTDVNALVEAINSGVVYKYVTKPWLNEDLQQTVKRGLENYESNKRMHSLTLNNDRLSAGLKISQDVFVKLVANALNAKDEYALGHARRTSDYATAIGAQLSYLNQDELERLSLAALLHTIGQIGVPNRLLTKATTLTEEENQTLKLYSERTERLLMEIPEMTEVAVAVRHYRERYDGSGMPEGLSGARIPLFSRIIAVAAAYDEMTNQSSVSKDLRHDEVIAKLRENAGTQFDPTIVEALSEAETIRKIHQSSGQSNSEMPAPPSRLVAETTNIPSQQ